MVNKDNMYYIDSVLNGVNFSWDNTDDDDELEYYLVFMLLFEDLYRTYSTKTTDYILKHVDDDVDNILKRVTDNTSKLNDQYSKKITEIFDNVNIPKENIGKAKLDMNRCRYLIKEQKQTLINICNELKGQIKSTIYYIKNRNEKEDAFKLDPIFNRVVYRLKKMVSSGIQSANDNALRESYGFLYGNPLVNIITKHDDKVCDVCRGLEANNPYYLLSAPVLPVHSKCRCRIETVDGKGITQLPLTDEASKLRYYSIGGG